MINWIREGLSKSNTVSDSSFSVFSQSTIQVQISPKEPHTSSNIILTPYKYEFKTMLIPVKVKWFRSKYFNLSLSSEQKSISVEAEQIKDNTSTTYQCNPSDLGYFLHARIEAIQDQKDFAKIVIGPIKIDPMIKTEMQNYLTHQLFTSAVNFVSGEEKKQGKINISSKLLEINSTCSNEKILMQYNISKPIVQISKKGENLILMGFQEETHKAKKFLDSLFPDQDSIIEELIEQNSSKVINSRIFKQHVSLLQIQFHSRQTRDCFLLMRKALICKQSMKNSVVFEQLEQMKKNNSQISLQKFLEFMELKEEVHRLYLVAKAIQLDRNKKIKDLINLEESIQQITHTYLKIIEDIGKKQEHDLNKSYQDIAIRRQELMQRKQIKQIKEENISLHKQVKLFQGQLNAIKNLKKQNELQLGFKKSKDPTTFSQQIKQIVQRSNQDSPPINYKRKLIFSSQSPILQHQKNPQQINNAGLIQQLRSQNMSLKLQIDVLRSQLSPKFDLSESALSFKNSLSNIIGESSQHNFEFQQPMSSQLADQKFMHLSNLNKRLLQENSRIRKQRQKYKQIAKNYRAKYKELEKYQNERQNIYTLQDNDVKHKLQLSQEKCIQLTGLNIKLQSQISMLKKRLQEAENNVLKIIDSKSCKDVNEQIAKTYLQQLGYESIYKVELQNMHKKLKDLNDQVLFLRRSTDVLDKSRNLSEDLQIYYQEQLNTVRKQLELLKEQNEQLEKIKTKIEQQFKEYINKNEKRQEIFAINDLLN